MPDGTLLGPGALAKAVTKPYVTTYAWQTGDYCTHAGKVYKFIGEDLTQGEEWTPEHWSETKITDELNNLQDQIDNMTPETGTSMFSDIAFTINTNQWTESSGIYSYNYSNALIKSTSGIQVFYDPAFRNFVGDINVAKYTGYLTFTTTRQPVGAITGTIRIIDSISGTLPVTRGGTGAVNAKGARQNLNVSIKPIPIDFGTVSSLPQTAYDDDITAEMIAVRWDIGTPSACPKGITCTAAAGSVTISLDSNQTFSGESTIKLWLVNPRTVADNGTGQNQDQYVGDYVQVGAQTLTPTQKAQVLTNIGGASAASVTDLANSIGTVPSGETVEGQITGINSKLPMLGNATSFGAGISPASDANFFRTYDSSGKYYQFYFSSTYFSVHHRNADDSEIWNNEYYYKWQYVTKKQGSGYVTLPSNANEYLFVIAYGTSSAEQALSTSVVAPNDSSHVGAKNYTNGYYISANSNGAFQVAVETSNHRAALTIATINGTSYLDSSYLYVYYR